MFQYDRLAEEYNLEQQYRKPFAEIWKEEKDNPVFGPLSERMSVRARDGGLLVGDEEMEAASKCDPSWLLYPLKTTLIKLGGLGFYHAFCFFKV